MTEQKKGFTPHHVKPRSSEQGCRGASKQPPQRKPRGLTRDAGFTYTVSREQIIEYRTWPLDRRLKWLFQANKMRKFLIHGHPRAVLLGTITRYSRCEKPAVFSTELAACFTRLSKKEQAQFKSSKAQLYERSIQGIIHLRSNGEHLYLGSVHGRKSLGDPLSNILWKWDLWPQEK